jgi:hypothetical protein
MSIGLRAQLFDYVGADKKKLADKKKKKPKKKKKKV